MKTVRSIKIYYVPGIMSLMILPFLFICYAEKELKEKSLGVIPLHIADVNLPKKYPEMFKNFEGAFPPKRNYIDLMLTGDESADKIKLDFARLEISEILSTNDRTKGLHFHFGDSSQYWTFVKTVDILRANGAKTYMALDNDIWFYHFLPDTSVTNWICGTTYTDVVYERPKRSWWTNAIQLASVTWTSSWQLILGFITLLSVIIILKCKKQRAT